MVKKVLFHVEFSSPVKIDFSKLDSGNPGIGGTQYATLCLAIQIAKLSLYEVGIVCATELNVPAEISFVKKRNLIDAIAYAEEEKSILVFRPTINLDSELEKAINSTSAVLIAWAHVNPSQLTLRKLASAASVRRIVALGHRQYMTWIDNPVKRKSWLIKNGQYLPKGAPFQDDSIKYVSYLGSIVPQKGFHLLAKIWPEIHRKYPNLRLKVIGSGSLYDANAKLGPHGIAEQHYENLFMKSFGASVISVDFLGKLSATEKNRIVSSSYLGIVNPSGNTENCPASALDFEAYNVPVVSVFRLGLIDTIQHKKTGILVKNYKKIPGAVDMLLEQANLRDELSRNCRQFLETEFNFDKISTEWCRLFDGIETNSKFVMNKKDLIGFREHLSYFYAKYMTDLFSQVSIKSTSEIESSLKGFIRKFLH